MAMKFSRYITVRLYSVVSSSRVTNLDLLLKNLPLTAENVDVISFLHGDKLADIPPYKIIKNCEIFRNFDIGLNPVTSIVPCLKLHSSVIKHRIFLLQEMGVPVIDINLIYRFVINMKMPVKDFKKKSNIPMEQNIMTNLLCHIDDKISDPPPLELLTESLPVSMHFEKCLLYYTMCKLGINDLKIITYKSRKYRSFRLMTRMLEIFKEEIGVDKKYLQNHLKILNMCPDDARNVLESLQNVKIGTLTLHEAIKRKPAILQYDPENIKQLLESLKQFEVEDKAVNNNLECLQIRNDVFVKKMTHLLSLPDVKVWCKSARILYFLINEKIVTERINYLRETGFIKWASVYLLTSSKEHFTRFLEDELQYSNKRTYVKYILCKELGSDKQHVVDLFIRHPYWNRVSFVDMDNTLCSLKKNFSVEDICNNIHLILYPWSLITKTLEILQDSCKQNQNYTSSQLLALCLYWLEKSNHFTGDGVWNLNMEPSKSLKKEKALLQDDISYRSNESLDTLNKHLHTIDT